MDTKPLLFGLIGFFLGGLLVSLAATTFEADRTTANDSMSAMNHDLRGKSGAAFDEAFLAGMIVHHRGALDMARLAESRAEHQEIKDLSRDIIRSQQTEIEQMKDWQVRWNYEQSAHDMSH